MLPINQKAQSNFSNKFTQLTSISTSLHLCPRRLVVGDLSRTPVFIRLLLQRVISCGRSTVSGGTP
ncbi:hypothetical protein HanIR_Chr16g0789861 [Helianthus annuus]|nr:hypothetical protein HanIR_Chr16g0789861 [Helianthus annuus]